MANTSTPNKAERESQLLFMDDPIQFCEQPVEVEDIMEKYQLLLQNL